MPHHFLNELRDSLATVARRPAVRHRGQVFSYGDLERRALSAAALLQGHGMAPGDRVVLLTGAKLPFLIGYLGVLFGGGVAVPLNPRFTQHELCYFLANSGARLVIGGPQECAMLEAVRPLVPGAQNVLADEQVASAAAAQPASVDPGRDDACLMVYSSGTTGQPKGVVHTHANLAASLRALQCCWSVTADDVIVNVLPLFHIHGLSFATQLSLLAGGCLLLEDAFDTERTLDVIGQGTVFMAVPTIYYKFLDHPRFADAAQQWTAVRLFTCGSAPIRREVLPRLESILGRPVINRYGMTEAHVITSLPLPGPWPQGSVGLPLDGIDLCIVDADGEPVPAGVVGEVQVRGSNLFREYWGRPDATRDAFVSGWFRTGDLGARDEAGFLTLAGRSNDLIITNGYNVYPAVVEGVLNACPGVRESAVFGVPDETRGERVTAAIVRADPALDLAALRAFLGARLVDYQRPRTICFVDELPRNALGKVLRRVLVLRAQLEPPE